MSSRCDIIAELGRCPKPVGKKMAYGTAGFRSHADNLTHVMQRCGVVATIVSHLRGGKTVGVMITASHNAACDNGVKIVDFNGCMIPKEYEEIAYRVVNAEDCIAEIETIYQENGMKLEGLAPASVVIGYDTRASSPGFFASMTSMAKLLGANVVDGGLVTTPMLHFFVWWAFRTGTIGTNKDYFDYYHSKFVDFGCEPYNTCSPLVFDSACGVAGVHAAQWERTLKLINVSIDTRNTASEGTLNLNAGSDHVQSTQSFPQLVGSAHGDKKGSRMCAVDGDGDRIVYFSEKEDGSLDLLDGDKIAVLYLKCIDLLLKDCEKASTSTGDVLSVTCCQTAYANGGSTNAIQAIIDDPNSFAGLKSISFDIRCTKTGVKNLHHVAETYSIGVYFEANGHGTVIYDEEKVTNWAKSNGIESSGEYKKLLSYLQVFNISVGDAFTDMLAVELSLRMLNMSIRDWSKLYSNLHYLMVKVPLSREILDAVKPHPEHEKYLISPTSLQNKLNAQVEGVKDARAFVRPSGTEDVCRLYVEAAEKSTCKSIADSITEAIKDWVKDYEAGQA